MVPPLWCRYCSSCYFCNSFRNCHGNSSWKVGVIFWTTPLLYQSSLGWQRMLQLKCKEICWPHNIGNATSLLYIFNVFWLLFLCCIHEFSMINQLFNPHLMCRRWYGSRRSGKTVASFDPQKEFDSCYICTVKELMQIQLLVSVIGILGLGLEGIWFGLQIRKGRF